MGSKLINPTKSDLALCADFAKKITRALEEPRSAGNVAAARLTSHGLDLRGQMLAKLAEVSFCRFAELDPHLALNWVCEPDDGTDVEWIGRKWDVKHTERGRMVLWPFNKKLSAKRFDHFALVTGNERAMKVEGWCTRQFFEANHIVHDGKVLTAGTLTLDKDKLRSFDEIVAWA